MTGCLAKFLSSLRRVFRTNVEWGDGIELEVAAYLCSDAPPPEFVQSVRAIVLKEDSVLVMDNPGGSHIIPGGRVEENETIEEALRRELRRQSDYQLYVSFAREDVVITVEDAREFVGAVRGSTRLTAMPPFVLYRVG